MRFKIVFSIALIMLAFCPVKLNAEEAISGKLPYLNVSWGLLNYDGDLSKIEKIGNYYNPTFGLEMSLSYVFWNTLGLELHSLVGQISHEQNTTNILHNFETTMIGGGLNVVFQMNNGFIFPVTSKLSPFVFVGATPFAYWAQGDFRNGDDYYHYWSDGSIRNIDEQASNASSAKVIRRDYDFERSYRGLNGDDVMAFALNIGGGFRFEITDWLDARLRVSYSLTNSDFIDGYEGGADKDNYFFGNFGLTLDPNAFLIAIAGDDEASKVEDINVDEFLDIDSDGDGVTDLNDKCSGTPLGTKVGSDGCAKVEVSESNVDSLSMMADSLVVLRKNLCRDYPMLCGEGEDEYLEIDGRTKRRIKVKKPKKQDFPDELPADDVMKAADLNNDGKVELPELYNAIELFFDGKTDITLPQLRKLIDHFFDQY